MPNQSSRTTYTSVAIALHWIIGLAILGNIAGALIAEDLTKEQAAVVMALHKATGITILVLSLIRIAWRLSHKPPPFLPSVKPWEAMLARSVHGLFYVLMIAVPLAGWALVSAAGRPPSYFGLFNVPLLPVTQGKDAAGTFAEAHEIMAFMLLGLAALHIAGALKHHFADRDGTLGRMLPLARRGHA